jgi:hypothetical protein
MCWWANLPYIPRARFDELPREVRAFEPRRALDGGEDGLALFRRLLAQLPAHAARGAVALLEISEEQGPRALECVRQELPHATVTLHRDLELLERVVEVVISETVGQWGQWNSETVGQWGQWDSGTVRQWDSETVGQSKNRKSKIENRK